MNVHQLVTLVIAVQYGIEWVNSITSIVVSDTTTNGLRM